MTGSRPPTVISLPQTGRTTATALLSGSNHEVLDLVHDMPMHHSIHYDHGAGELRVDLTAAKD